jgi:hypothetical protein
VLDHCDLPDPHRGKAAYRRVLWEIEDWWPVLKAANYQRETASSSRAFRKGNAMKLPRRQFLHLAAGAAALPAVTRVARAQAYPTRPARSSLALPLDQRWVCTVDCNGQIARTP